MRRVLPLMSLLLVLASAAVAAPAPRQTPRPAPRPAATAPIATIAPPASLLAPPSSLSVGLQGLTSPATGGDRRPQCRTDCSKRRYLCAPEDQDCSDRWNQCLAACARP